MARYIYETTIQLVVGAEEEFSIRVHGEFIPAERPIALIYGHRLQHVQPAEFHLEEIYYRRADALLDAPWSPFPMGLLTERQIDALEREAVMEADDAEVAR